MHKLYYNFLFWLYTELVSHYLFNDDFSKVEKYILAKKNVAKKLRAILIEEKMKQKIC